MIDELPPGQRPREDFPRFGLWPYAERFPADVTGACLRIQGGRLAARDLVDPLAGLERVEQISDFHCVTTWSRRRLRWSGVRIADFYAARIAPLLPADLAVDKLALRAQDGYRTTLPLADLLAADVLLADRLDGEPLSVAHGAPLRLVAPAHYGYKSVKHLARIDLLAAEARLRPAAFAFMDHPRARVAFEERGCWLPGWLLRRLYRPLIGTTVRRFAAALAKRGHEAPPRRG